MATASELKEKATKILTIVEYLEDENINTIEKDILLQAVRDLYSDILLTKTDISEEEKNSQVEEKEIVEDVEETPAENEETSSETPIMAIPFDAGEFDFHDLFNHEEENVEEAVANESAEVENVIDEIEEVADMPEEIVEEQHADVPEEVEEPVTQETENEVLEEEPVVENEYFAQSESVSSDFCDTVSNETPVAEKQPEEIVEAPIDDEPIVEPVVEEAEESVVEPVAEEIEEPAVDENPVAVEPEESCEAIVPEAPVTPVEPIRHEPEQEKVITLGEQLGQSRQESLNDKFANNKSADLSSRIGLKPITDIRSSIGLGERYRFTRMLFAGSGPAFDDTVAKLNQMSSMEDAEGYVIANFNWDMESPIVADFMNIVRRRYL